MYTNCIRGDPFKVRHSVFQKTIMFLIIFILNNLQKTMVLLKIMFSTIIHILVLVF